MLRFKFLYWYVKTQEITSPCSGREELQDCGTVFHGRGHRDEHFLEYKNSSLLEGVQTLGKQVSDTYRLSFFFLSCALSIQKSRMLPERKQT